MAGQKKICEGRMFQLLIRLSLKNICKQSMQSAIRIHVFFIFAEKLQLKPVILAGSTNKLEEANGRKHLMKEKFLVKLVIWRNKCYMVVMRHQRHSQYIKKN